MEKMLALRRQIAALLGYDTWADYRTEVKMVKTGQNVKEVHATPLTLSESASDHRA